MHIHYDYREDLGVFKVRMSDEPPLAPRTLLDDLCKALLDNYPGCEVRVMRPEEFGKVHRIGALDANGEVLASVVLQRGT